MVLNLGKVDPLPFKSLILLKNHVKVKAIAQLTHHIYEGKKERKNKELKLPYRSLKLVRAEMLEGMGPSRELPWMCLQHKADNATI